jgi:hypothetical protein
MGDGINGIQNTHTAAGLDKERKRQMQESLWYGLKDKELDTALASGNDQIMPGNMLRPSNIGLWWELNDTKNGKDMGDLWSDRYAGHVKDYEKRLQWNNEMNKVKADPKYKDYNFSAWHMQDATPPKIFRNGNVDDEIKLSGY